MLLDRSLDDSSRYDRVKSTLDYAPVELPGDACVLPSIYEVSHRVRACMLPSLKIALDSRMLDDCQDSIGRLS